jgi:hypothetical protein
MNILYIIGFIVFILIELNLNNNNKLIITIYKNPIFKLIFLFSIYLYGNNDIIFTLLCATYYIYLSQKILEKEIINNVIY